MIFVNKEKEARAKEILGLIEGSVVPQNELEIERKSRFTQLLKTEKVKAGEELEFIYKKLGGLVRSEAEQAKFLEKVKASIKGKK